MKILKLMFVIVLLSLLVGISSGVEFTDNFQHQITADNWKSFNFGANQVQGPTIVTYGPTYNKECWTEITPAGGGNYGGVRNKYPFQSNYWSFFLHEARTGYNTGYITVNFWDSTNTTNVNFNVYGPFQSDNNWVTINRHLEFQYESGSIYWKINGVSQGIACACTFTPAYIGIGGGKSSSGYVALNFDNVHNQEGIIGICDESNNVEHSITELTNDLLSNTWGINTIPIADYNASQYDIEVKRATWAEIYNTTRIKNATEIGVTPYGNFAYSWSDIFRTDHYGLYWFNLYRTLSGEPELMGQDFIYFKDVGEPSTINIEETEYAIGETMNISYYIDSPDFGANQYKIQIFDATGQVKDTRVLTQQAATEYITSTIDWEEGMLYAVLVKDTKPAITEDPPEDIIDLAYDFCTMSNVIYITGTVYDASNYLGLVDGSPLANVSLNWTHAGTIHNTTSNLDGSYEFIDPSTLLEVEWFQDVPIEVTAYSTDNPYYTHDDFTMTIIKAGRYIVDIYLTPISTSATQINGLVLDDIFHQAVPYATVNIWNGITNSTYTNNWGWYEFTGLSNGTYYMTAGKETYRTSSVVTVPTYDVNYTLDTCDNLTYYEAVLDDCDSTTSWSSDNTLTLNTTDYIEAIGSLQSVGSGLRDFYKTFSPGIDSNVSVTDGYFYFYSKILNTTNISSQNVTVTISSNTTGATDKRVWLINKTYFNDTWDLYVLKISNSVQTGICNLSNITYFKFESTKSGNVTTLIDYLAFIEYAGWDSCLDLSIDTSNKIEGTGSLHAEGLLLPTCDLVLGMFWTPVKNCGVISKNSDLSRLRYWQWDTQIHTDNVYLFDSDGDYMFWAPETDAGWDLEELYFKDAVESGDFDTSKVSYLAFYSSTPNTYNIRFDDVKLTQIGNTRQNFYLSQNYNLTVYAKDMDTRYTITSFTAVLDSTTVAETTTGAIVFPNVTYAIYPLEVSANGYYTNKQYVFMGQDTTQTVYLTKIENVSGEGVGQYYAPPHLVEFRVENIWGRPYENVHINATAQQTTMGAWEWLASVFGYRTEIAAEIQNGSMNGTTDTYGAMSFMMTETIKYKVHVYNVTQGIDKIVYVYPKEERYIIICSVIRWEQNGTEEMRELTINVTTNTINDTHANITVEYYDPSNTTTNLTFYVNKTTNYNEQVNVDSYNVVSDSNETHSFTVTPISGRSFFVRVATVNDEWGTKTWDFAVKFPGLLIDLGLPTIAYPMMAIALILFTGGLFGASSATQGSLICCLEGWVFLGMGWFATVASSGTMGMALSLATVISILAIIMEKGRRTGVQ